MPIEKAQAPNKSDMVTKKATWQQKGKWVPKVSQEEGLAPTPMIPAPTSQIAAASTIPSQTSTQEEDGPSNFATNARQFAYNLFGINNQAIQRYQQHLEEHWQLHFSGLTSDEGLWTL